MLCPRCRSEYRDGFVRCDDCDVELVANLPPAPGDERSKIQLVDVFETGDPTAMTLLESLLGDAGIDFTTSSQTAKDYYAGGRLGVARETGGGGMTGDTALANDGTHAIEVGHALHWWKLRQVRSSPPRHSA